MKIIEQNIKSNDLVSTLVGAGTKITGSIEIKNSARIDGIVHGDVTSDNIIVIGEGGYIEGTISAKGIIVGGSVMGSLRATVNVQLEKSAKLQGDIHTMKLYIDDGAQFNGKACMLSQNQDNKAAVKLASERYKKYETPQEIQHQINN